MRPARLIKELRLERFSAEFAKALLARHPEWSAYTGFYEKEEDGLGVRYLEVRVPPPNPRMTEPLLIQTWPGEEVYLEWAGLHTHFYAVPGEAKDQGALFGRALGSIDLWASDDHLIGTVYREGRVVEAAGGLVGNDPVRVLRPRSGDRVVARSWRGTHDNDWTAGP